MTYETFTIDTHATVAPRRRGNLQWWAEPTKGSWIQGRRQPQTGLKGSRTAHAANFGLHKDSRLAYRHRLRTIRGSRCPARQQLRVWRGKQRMARSRAGFELPRAPRRDSHLLRAGLPNAPRRVNPPPPSGSPAGGQVPFPSSASPFPLSASLFPSSASSFHSPRVVLCGSGFTNGFCHPRPGSCFSFSPFDSVSCPCSLFCFCVSCAPLNDHFAPLCSAAFYPFLRSSLRLSFVHTCLL